MFEIADIVNVINTGQTYSTYMAMAKTLGADLNAEEWDSYNSSTSIDNRTSIIRNSKWRLGSSPSREGNYKILNIKKAAGSVYYLIEHIKSRKQYVMAATGLKRWKYKPVIILEEDLFEI